MRWALLFITFSCAYSYVFECLDNCECDTDDEVVHCHNGNRKELPLPTGQRLRGFPVIGMTYNDLHRLPEEGTLLTKFPDLKVIDVERNPNFDCESLKEYDKVKIVSDCFKNVSEVSKVPRIFRPTKDCDISCQAARHYQKLHEYVMELWEILKQKFQDFDVDATLKQVQQFFVELGRRVNKFGTDVQVSLKKATENIGDSAEEKKENVMTPAPELQDLKKEQ